jgi:hypothetical protein
MQCDEGFCNGRSFKKTDLFQRKQPGEGTARFLAIIHVFENIRRRTGEMRKSGAATGARAKHILKHGLPFLPNPCCKGSLCWEKSCDKRSSGYLGRGCARIETGSSTTCARGLLACIPLPAPARPESHISISQVVPSPCTQDD